MAGQRHSQGLWGNYVLRAVLYGNENTCSVQLLQLPTLMQQM